MGTPMVAHEARRLGQAEREIRDQKETPTANTRLFVDDRVAPHAFVSDF